MTAKNTTTPAPGPGAKYGQNPANGRDPTVRVILAVGLAAGVAVMLAWAWLPVRTLIEWIPDDSFYYFQPASLMARGYIPSFDGVHAGNGFHPLWMLLLVPVCALKPLGADLPVHLGLSLAGVMYVFTGYLIYRILRQMGVSGLFSAYGGATFALWPSAVTTAVDGEVTPVNVLVLALLFLVYTRILLAAKARRRDFVAWGLVAGLAVLARNDNTIVLGLMGLFYLLLRRGENKAASLALAAVAAVAAVLPWLAWNYSVAGEVWPTSTWAVPMLEHAQPRYAGLDLGGYLATAWSKVVGYLTMLFFYSPLKAGVLVLYGVVAFAAIRGRRLAVATLGIFLAALVALYVINAGVRWYVRTWHLGMAFLVNQLFLWYGLYAVFGKMKWARAFAHAAAALAVGFFVVDGVYTSRHVYFPWQSEMLNGGRWAAAHPHYRIGAFNCGLLAYYGAGNVVDLDGNMNVEGYRALRARRLYDYCRAEGVDYLVDYESWSLVRYRSFWPADRVGRLEFYSDELDDPRHEFRDTPYYIYRLR